MSKVAVFGAGSWGTAFSIVLADAGNDVTIWARREDVCATINDSRENPDYLPGIELPPAITATHDPELAAGRRRVRGARRPLPDAAREPRASGRPLPRDAVLVSLMKGVELGTLKRMSEVIAEVTGAGPERIGVVSGPNLAMRSPAGSPPPAWWPAPTRRSPSACATCATRRRSVRTRAPTWSAASSAAPTRT